jgi:hypothetical protein
MIREIQAAESARLAIEWNAAFVGTHLPASFWSRGSPRVLREEVVRQPSDSICSASSHSSLAAIVSRARVHRF